MRVALLIFLAAVVALAFPKQPANPIIGIMVEPPAWSDNLCVSVWGTAGVSAASPAPAPAPTYPAPTMPPSGNFSGCVWSVYVAWLEAAGIRVLPIPWNAEPARRSYLLSRVNGVLFPGGIIQGDAPVTDAYFAVVQAVLAEVLEMNRRGDPMVIWGTCQGFEMLCAAAAGGMAAISSGFVGTDPAMLSVNLTAAGAASTSRLFGGLTPDVKQAMQKNATTLNWHSKGVVPASFAAFPSLGATLVPLATSVDANGRTFVAAVEGANGLPLFATQFHPERPPVEFDNDVITHGPLVVGLSQQLALTLRQQLMLNNHTFENATEAESLLIANHKVVNLGWGIQVYFV